MLPVTLVRNWLKVYVEAGRTKADALRELNAELGTKYDSSHLSRWERGEPGRSPSSEARYVMLLKVLPTIIANPTPKRVKEAAEALR